MTLPPASGLDLERGVVLGGTGGIWRVRTVGGETREASLRGRLKTRDSTKLAVGDDVRLEVGDTSGSWCIAEVLPRRSQLSRREPGGGRGERTVAANIDQVVVVFAIAKPEPHPRMLDRFLVIAEGNGVPARIVINKVDLVDQASARVRFADYDRAGYDMHYTSAKQGIGMDELHDVLHDRTSVLTGPSGVGKSSLMNALFPGLNLRVGEISESVNKGRHTTVGALMHPLPDGGFVVDTPGLREVGLWGLPTADLAACFPEFRKYLDNCRFADCTHQMEPGCAVRDAVSAGEVSAARHDSYVKLREELKASERSY